MLKKVGNQDYILKLFNNQNNLKHLKYYKYFFLSDIRIFNRIYGLFINDTNNSLVDNSFNYKKVDVGLKNFSLFTLLLQDKQRATIFLSAFLFNALFTNVAFSKKLRVTIERS